jgi:hypothetical protein
LSCGRKRGFRAFLPDMYQSTYDASVSAICAAALAILAARGIRRLRGTTLAAPAVWVILVALVQAAVALALAIRSDWRGSFGASLAHYAADVGTLCPMMAVLGAKRPQDRGWQWVVAALWVVLLVPAVQSWAGRSASTVQVSLPWLAAMSWLSGMTLWNYLTTRWAIPAFFVFLSQLQFLYWLPGFEWEGSVIVGCLFAAIWVTVATLRRQTPSTEPLSLAAFDQRWLKFRNGWGAFWGLRIRNRINEAAELAGWPVRLEWGGFAPAEKADENSAAASLQIEPRVAAHIEQTMDSVLRRFERVDKPQEPTRA